MAQCQPKLLVGLGNPGLDYADTRHNIGFMVIDQFLSKARKGVDEPRHFADSLIWSFAFAGRRIWLQKPLTFMNLSGKAVAKLCREQQLLPEEVLVISDDVDLPFGQIRLRRKGGDGGHNGLKDIIAQLGTQKFNRLRLGIGRSTGTNSGMVDHVLGPFTEDELSGLPVVTTAAVQAVQLAIRRGMDVAMNQYNGLVFEEEKSETKEE